MTTEQRSGSSGRNFVALSSQYLTVVLVTPSSRAMAESLAPPSYLVIADWIVSDEYFCGPLRFKIPP